MDEESEGFAASIYPQIGTNTPPGVTGTSDPQLGTSALFPVEFGKVFGEFRVAADFGYIIAPNGGNSWAGGTAVSYPVSDGLDLLAEIRDAADAGSWHINNSLFNLGTRIALTPKSDFLFSVGKELGSSEDRADFLLCVGITLNL